MYMVGGGPRNPVSTAPRFMVSVVDAHGEVVEFSNGWLQEELAGEMKGLLARYRDAVMLEGAEIRVVVGD